MRRRGLASRGGIAALSLLAWLVPAPSVSATFSGPNGPLAYTHYVRGGEICLINPDGSGRHCLTHNRVEDKEPAFSPDGTKIAFVHGRTGRSTIWLMNRDGTHKHRVIALGRSSSDPAFAPSGSRLAFSCFRRHRPSEIYSAKLNSSGMRQLTHHFGGERYSPSYSPDGLKIALEWTTVGDIGISLINVGGSGRRDLTTAPDDDFSTVPDFSPSGDQIAYTSFHHFDPKIYVMNADGSDQHAITSHPSLWDWNPTFSPQGDQIAYDLSRVGDHQPSNAGIHIVNVDGSGDYRVPHTSGMDAASSWDPTS